MADSNPGDVRVSQGIGRQIDVAQNDVIDPLAPYLALQLTLAFGKISTR